MIRKFRMTLRVIALIALCGLESCDQGDETLDDFTNSPDGELIVTGQGTVKGAVVKKIIGRSGGTLEMPDGKLSLIVPAEALDKDQEISIQPIENLVPNGLSDGAFRFEPHGLSFKSPVTLEVRYVDEDIAGSDPGLMFVATQLTNGSWKREGDVSIDEAAGIVRARITHFSDWAFFLSHVMKDSKTGGEDAEINLPLTDTVEFNISQTAFGSGDELLIVPIVPSGRVLKWEINGGVAQDPGLPLSHHASFIDPADANSFQLKKIFKAPVLIPPVNPMAVSASLDFSREGRSGTFLLVRNVKMTGTNEFKVNTKSTAIGVVLVLVNDVLTMSMTDLNNPLKQVSFIIKEFSGPGTYTFSQEENVTATAADGEGRSYSHKYSDKHGVVHYAGGSITITSGVGGSDILIGALDANLFEETTNGTVNQVQVLAKFTHEIFAF